MSARRCASLAVCLLVLLGQRLAAAHEKRLIAFEIADQFETVHTQADYLGSPLIVIGSDRHGSQFSASWGRALRDTLAGVPGTDELRFLRVADARGVPRLMRAFVREKFPKDKGKRALADWEGRFAEAYQFEKKAANILVFDTEGVLIHQVQVREFDRDQLAVITEKVLSILSP